MVIINYIQIMLILSSFYNTIEANELKYNKSCSNRQFNLYFK